MADTRKPLILTLDLVEPSPKDDVGAAPLASTEPSSPPEAEAESAPAALTPSVPSRVDAVASRRRRRDEAAATAAAEPQPHPVKVVKPPRASKPPRVLAEPREPAPRPQEAGPGLARWAYPTAAVAAVLWAGCLVTFAVGYERGAAAFEFAPLRWAVTGLLALLPAALMLVFGYMVRQSARLAEQSRRTQAMADVMSGPAALAGAHAQGAVGAMREEIARAQAAADEIARRMSALGDSLAEETRRVSEAAVQAERAASRLGGRLQSERAELSSLSGALDAQLASASEGAARHARLAAEASDLAGANLHEAQAALAARTADLVSAAGEAARASDVLGDDLAQRGDRLERLAEGLKAEQAQWAAVAQALLADQEDMAARLETERARFGDAAAEARAAGDTLQAAATDGSGALEQLARETAQAREVLDAAARDHAAESAGRLAAAQAALESEHQAALERIARSADAAREEAVRSASKAAAEAEAAGEAARRRVEGLAEAAFAAGQRADQAFDSRLTAARRALESQAALIEEAGLRSTAQIEAGVEALRAAARRERAPDAAAAPPPPAPPAPPAPASDLRVEPQTESRVSEGFARLERTVDPPAPQAEPEAAPPEPAAAPPLRSRLALAAVDEELFASPARDASASQEGGSDEWSWKDLLTAIEDPQLLDDDALAERMIGEIEAMGVDPGALLPRARIDEIARAVDAGDSGRAREAVRRLAPAAVRRLSRRVMTDKVLRGQADLYRRRYGDLVRDERSRHGGDGNGAVSALLGSDPGRAFLLLDAAVGDLH